MAWPPQGGGYAPPGPYPPPMHAPGGAMAWRCPFCQNVGPPLVTKKMTTGGIIMMVVLLFLCLPLFWVPIVTMKEEIRSCMRCGSRAG